jgi:hypothetical protein
VSSGHTGRRPVSAFRGTPWTVCLVPGRSDLDVLVTRRSHEAASTINALYAADWTDSAPLLAAALVSYASLVATT